MSLFGGKQSKQYDKWDALFPDVTEQDIKQTKIMVYYCLHFMEGVPIATNILSSMTIGQRIESIAFFKTYVFHLVDIAPIHHNLFYGLLCEFYGKNYKMELNECIKEINQIKQAEKWYVESYLESDKEDKASNLNDRYYFALKRFENENDETHLKVSKDKFSQAIGHHIANFHETLLNEYSKQR